MEQTNDVSGPSPVEALTQPDTAQQADTQNVNSEEQKQVQEPSAETKNTDKPPAGYVPLQALHEAREQLKALKESQDWKAYTLLKERMDADPAFSGHLTKSIQDFLSGMNQQEKDALADYPAEIAEPLRKAQMLESQVQQLLQATQTQRTEAVFQQYKSALSEKLKDVPAHWKSLYEQKVLQVGGQLNPNALNAYDAELVSKAFDMVDQEFKAIQRAERSMYVTDKTKDNLPPSTSSTGVPGQSVNKPSNEYERARLIEELMKQGQA
jgi:hypothetical protein